MVNPTNDELLNELQAKKFQAMLSYNFDEAIQIQNQINKMKGSFSGVMQSSPSPTISPSPTASPSSPQPITPQVIAEPVSSPVVSLPEPSLPPKVSSEKNFFNQLDELDQIFVKNLLLRGGIVHSKINTDFFSSDHAKYLDYVYDILNLCKKQKDERSTVFYLGFNADVVKNYLLNLDANQLDDVIKIFTYMKQTTESLKDIYIGMDLSIKNFEGKDFLLYYNLQKGEKASLSSDSMKDFSYSMCTKLFYFESLYSNIISLLETVKIISLQK